MFRGTWHKRYVYIVCLFTKIMQSGNLDVYVDTSSVLVLRVKTSTVLIAPGFRGKHAVTILRQR